MGWWENRDRIWGDGPADIMDEALDKIAAEFRSEWKRDPTYAELWSDQLRSVMLQAGPTA